MSLSNEFNADEIFVPEITETATYNSNGYRCVPSRQSSALLELPEVTREQITMAVRLAVVDFATLPEDGDKLALRGNTYRIISRPMIDAAGCTFVLALGDEFGRRQ